MDTIPPYPPLKKPDEDPVTKSVAKPHAFAKSGTLATQTKATRFRPLATKRPPGRPRTRKRDRRDVTFY